MTPSKGYYYGQAVMATASSFDHFDLHYHRDQQKLSLIMFDIDHFKRFNDTHGHQMGDDVLKELSAFVDKRVRSTDLFARWGGEEFIIILTSTELDCARSFAEDIRLSIQQHSFKNNLKLTCSFGIAEIDEDETEEALLKRADSALYQAKRGGRNKVI